jgi:hypothetical protein
MRIRRSYGKSKKSNRPTEAATVERAREYCAGRSDHTSVPPRPRPVR